MPTVKELENLKAALSSDTRVVPPDPAAVLKSLEGVPISGEEDRQYRLRLTDAAIAQAKAKEQADAQSRMKAEQAAAQERANFDAKLKRFNQLAAEQKSLVADMVNFPGFNVVIRGSKISKVTVLKSPIWPIIESTAEGGVLKLS